MTVTNQATQTGLASGTALTAANSAGGTNTALANVNPVSGWTVDNGDVLMPSGATVSYLAPASAAVKTYLSMSNTSTGTVRRR
jgi:hypothetical protein